MEFFLPSMHKAPGVLSPALHRPGVVAKGCTASIEEVEAGRSKGLCQHGQHSDTPSHKTNKHPRNHYTSVLGWGQG